MDRSQKQGHIVAIIIMIFSLFVAVLISVLISQTIGKETKPYKETESNKENTNNKEEYEKIDKNKEYYYIQKGNEYELLPEEDEKTIISFSYPIINSKDESVTKINDEIKNLYIEQEKNILLQNGSTCTCIKINGTKKCGQRANFYKYEIIEKADIINIKIIKESVTNCASGSSELEKSYFISKTTGKVLSNSEIIKKFNYTEDNLITAYNKYINKLNNKHKGEFDGYKNISSIDNLTFILIKEDNKIKLGISGPGYGNGSKFELEFDGNIIIGFDADEENGILKSE